MVEYFVWIELAGYALGTLGGALVFFEYFQTPNYVRYNEQSNRYRIQMSLDDAKEYSPVGRIGAFLLALAFALLFVATLFGR